MLFRPPAKADYDQPEYEENGVAYFVYYPQQHGPYHFRVLFLHGNSTTIAHPVNTNGGQLFADYLSSEVYTFDYYGYGQSEAQTDKSGVERCRDSTRVMLTSAIKKNTLTKNKPVIVIGHSLGASVILDLLNREPELAEDIAMVVTISAMTSPIATVSRFAAKILPSWLDWYNTIGDMRKVLRAHPDLKLLNAHGLQDTEVRVTHQQDFTGMCAQENLTNYHAITLPQAGHNSILEEQHVRSIASHIEGILSHEYSSITSEISSESETDDDDGGDDEDGQQEIESSADPEKRQDQ